MNQVEQSLRDQLLNAPEVPPDDDEGPDDDLGTLPPEPEKERVEIFPGCPVTPLGVFGEVSFYLDVQGQLRGIDNHTAQKMLHVFGGRIAVLARAFPQFYKNEDGIVVPKKDKFDQGACSAAMIAACDRMGVWSPTNKVRGAGCWVDDDGKLVYHAGNQVLIGGEWRPPGFHQGHIYAADVSIPRPAEQLGRINPATAVLELFGAWNWRRSEIDPMLLLGCLCVMVMGGALDWRNGTWMTGAAGTGKSTLQKAVLYLLGGREGLKKSSDATEAGIRSALGHSCIPVALDELEPEDDPRDAKAKNIIKLARIAASGDQAFRGSSDQKGSQSNVFSAFLFSSINIPPLKAQDRSRLVVLDLDPLEHAAKAPPLDPRKLRALGAGLRRLLMDRWPAWQQRLELWKAALSETGQNQRGADTYATPLALADMVLRETMPSQDLLTAWAEKLRDALDSEGVEVGSTAEDMMTWLLGQPMDIHRRGEQFTVAQWIMVAAQLPGAPSGLLDNLMKEEKPDRANEALAKYGLRVRHRAENAELFIPNNRIPNLCQLFEGSMWAEGVWKQDARRLPGATPVASPLTLAGQRTRGVYVPVKNIAGLVAFPATRTVAPEGASAFPDDMRDFE
ncbi:hypothetical protein [Oceaniglobus trochenteri]|uniref:hypothetical protein n=1 Tax=Oceaniglobus trochenteri TaxID=2763260 RepID=UPI001CFF7F5A|nr:hypothetical protein [Oceaniglobus trochenteri]